MNRRTPELLAKVYACNLKLSADENKNFWLIPNEQSYNNSIHKPDPLCLPAGTTAYLYDKYGNVLDTVQSCQKQQ